MEVVRPTTAAAATTEAAREEENNNNNDPNLDRKLDVITAGSPAYLKEHLLTRISHENCQTIINYIFALQTEVGPSETYRVNTVQSMKHFRVPQAQDLQGDKEAGRHRLPRLLQETREC